jgi:hypothetical protein
MPRKKGPLSKAETFYIEQHVKLGSTIDVIAHDLDRTQQSIEEAFNKIQTQHAANSRVTVGTQMARQAGVTIMTENASTMSDSTRKKTKNTIQNCISIIKKANEQA